MKPKRAPGKRATNPVWAHGFPGYCPTRGPTTPGPAAKAQKRGPRAKTRGPGTYPGGRQAHRRLPGGPGNPRFPAREIPAPHPGPRRETPQPGGPGAGPEKGPNRAPGKPGKGGAPKGPTGFFPAARNFPNSHWGHHKHASIARGFAQISGIFFPSPHPPSLLAVPLTREFSTREKFPGEIAPNAKTARGKGKPHIGRNAQKPFPGRPGPSPRVFPFPAPLSGPFGGPGWALPGNSPPLKSHRRPAHPGREGRGPFPGAPPRGAPFGNRVPKNISRRKVAHLGD